MKTAVHSMQRLAERFVAAIETADVAALDAIYTKNAFGAISSSMVLSSSTSPAVSRWTAVPFGFRFASS
jgi:hypothetical protein